MFCFNENINLKFEIPVIEVLGNNENEAIMTNIDGTKKNIWQQTEERVIKTNSSEDVAELVGVYAV